MTQVNKPMFLKDYFQH